MLFGLGAHSCLGLHIAEAQVLQTMKALLRRKNLQRAPGKKGKLEWLGQIPGRLFVTFKVERGPVH
jgi:cytochrome P450